jgi:hypothetical protein
MIERVAGHRIDRDDISRRVHASLLGLCVAVATATPALAAGPAPASAAAADRPTVSAASDEALPGEGRPPSPGPTEPDRLVERQTGAGPGQRQPRPGATWVRMASMTWAL